MTKIRDLVYGHADLTGVVSISANYQGKSSVWRVVEGSGFKHESGCKGKTQRICEQSTFQNWLIVSDRRLLDRFDDYTVTELQGNFPRKWLIETSKYRQLERTIISNHNRIHHDNATGLYKLKSVYSLNNPIEQYLVRSGVTYFKGLPWNDVHRLQFDLETTGLDPKDSEIFLIAITDSHGYERILDTSQMTEAEMMSELVNIINDRDPDVIENHNLFRFDLTFLQHRANLYGIQLEIGRDGSTVYRSKYDGTLKVGGETEKYPRFSIAGRELIDTYHAVKRWNAITRKLKRHGLKEAAQHFGLANSDREYIDGKDVPSVWGHDPERVKRYALDDVREVSGLSDMLMGTSFALAQMVPMTFERIATAGTATLIERMMIRGYVHAKHSLPDPTKKRGKFKGALMELRQTGVIQNVVKADAESLYPSIMLTYKIKPDSDALEIYLLILKHLTDERLAAKAKLKTINDPAEYAFMDAYQNALKILINSFFGYLGADDFLTFNAPEKANDVTRYGREILTEMEAIVEKLGGDPIELDTDGIFFRLPDGDDPDAFVDNINANLNREGIYIGLDGHWRSMYSVGKKNYALLAHDGNIELKGGGIRSTDTEPVFQRFVQDGFRFLLGSDISGLQSAYRSLVKAISDRTLTASDVSKSTRLSKAIETYQRGNKTTLPHYEAAIACGLTDLQAGDTVEYYRSETGWTVTQDDATDYDVTHYLKRLKKTTDLFRKAFHDADFRQVFSASDDLLSQIHGTIHPVQRKNGKADTRWIELVHGMKGNGRVIREWIDADDTDAITGFIERYDRTDCYRTQLAVHSPEPPRGSLAQYRRSGEFFIECEGSHDDLTVMQNAVRCASALLMIIRFQLGESVLIHARYNGGKSIYLFVRGLESKPVYRLMEKYKTLAESLLNALDDDLKPVVDMSLYTEDRVLRLEGTHYPDGGIDRQIPLSLIEAEDWTAIQRYQPDSETPKSNIEPEAKPQAQFYRDLTGMISNEPSAPQPTARRKRKAIRQAKAIVTHDPNFLIPCVDTLSGLIAAEESIGFQGRNKLISELTIRGRASGLSDREIENQIVDAFLTSGNASRYGDVLTHDERDDPHPSGYRLADRFSISQLDTFDASCASCAQWCDVDRCYRGEKFLSPEITRNPYADYRDASQAKLHAVLDDPQTFTGAGIQLVDAGIGSGKSFQSIRKALELSARLSVAIFVPTHAAGVDILLQIPKTGVDIGDQTIAIHVYGKREETCQPDKWEKQTACSQCPIYQSMFYKGKDPDSGAERKKANHAKYRRIKLIKECLAGALDLSDLQAKADEHGICASVVSKVLAQAERMGDSMSHNGLVVLPHAYLIDTRYQRFIHKINPGVVFVDEADMIPEMLLQTHRAEMTIAETRARLDSPYTKACNFQCDRCHVHFADTFGSGIEVKRKLQNAGQYTEIGRPAHFIGYLRESVETAKGILETTPCVDYFDFDAMERNIQKLESALAVVDGTGQTPIHYFDALQRTLQSDPPDGVTVETLSEAIVITETDEYGELHEKEIRPPTLVAGIDFETVLTEDAKLYFWGESQGTEPDDDLTLAPSLSLSMLLDDHEQRQAIADTDGETALKTMLSFMNFGEHASGDVGLYAELRSERSDAVNDSVESDEPDEMVLTVDSKRGGIKSCALRLRYLDVDAYQQVVRFLQSRNSILLSGTFLDKAKFAESLLMPADDIEYHDARVPLHDSALIIHHNPRFGKLAPNSISLAAFGNKHLAQLARRVVELRTGTKVLNFEVNARQGNVLYSGLAKDQQNRQIWIQNEVNPKLVIPNWCSPEVNDRQSFENWLFIDKLRSSTARAVNRAGFDVSIVHGNGYFDWYDYLPFVHAIKQNVNPDADLDTHIEYNRQRAVLQALLRTPRDERRTVCLYLSGDMSHLDYPDDLKGRVVTTNRLMQMLRAKYPDTFVSIRDNQVELLARVIVGFIDGTIDGETIDAVIQDFDFKGRLGTERSRTRKQDIDLSALSKVHRYLIESWLETMKDSTDNAKVIKKAVERLTHVDACISEKGYLDLVKDKKGERPDWKKWIEFLVNRGYLKSEIRKSTGKKSQTVFLHAENHANPLHN